MNPWTKPWTREPSSRNVLFVLGLAAAWAGWSWYRRRRRYDFGPAVERLEADPRPESTLPALLAGASRRAVRDMLGPPEATARAGVARRQPTSLEAAADDWWYYPLGKKVARTLALGFLNNRVVTLEVVERRPAQAADAGLSPQPPEAPGAGA